MITHTGSENAPKPGSSMVEGPEVVRIWLLGGFAVTVGPRTIGEGRWGLKKAATLVKLLALARGHRLHREQVMDLLWPDLGEAAASNNLRRTLHAARGAIDAGSGSRYLTSVDGSLVLCPDGPLWVDVDAFERAAETARHVEDPAAYRTAIELYAGELLPEDRYEGWADERREDLRRVHLELQLELAGTYEELRDYERGIWALRKVVSEEPVLEEAHVALMRLHALSDQRGQALAQYERLGETLARRLGAEPGEKAKRLREDIAAGLFPSPTPPSGPPQEETEDAPVSGKHNLPASRTSFVGRGREMVEVKRLLSMTRLLTLTGAGGSGKTRLAAEVARELVSSYRDGAWLVELAPLSEGDLVPQEVARALGVLEQPGRPLKETLSEVLSRKDVLLVVDNCEHLAGPVASLLDALLDSCPRLRVLATSREPMRVDGEVIWRVSSLSVPGAERMTAAEDLTRYESVRLFRERARLKLPAFEITQHNARSVAEVCRKLDGMPLAIELATARMGTIAVEEVAGRVEDSLRLLSGGARTAPPRQQTMRATIEWSHGLLSDPEKRLFRGLSVLAGSWTLAAAEAVGTSADIEKSDVLDLLSRLVDKSLVMAEAGVSRYWMLGPVRRYARDELDHSDETEPVLGRHAAYFSDVAKQAAPQLRGPLQLQWLETLTEELDDLRAAMRWLLEAGKPEAVARLGWELWLFWWIRGLFAEGRHWMEEALASGDAMAPRDRAKALFVAGTMAIAQADYRSAETPFEESIGLFGEQRDELGVAVAVGGAGIVAINQGRYEAGIALLGRARDLYRKLESEWWMSAVLVAAAGAWMALGDHGKAERTAGEGLALARKMGDRLAASIALYVLAAVAQASGDQGRAKELFGEGLALAGELGDRANAVYYLEELGAISASEGSPIRAARLWGAAEALLEETEATAYPHRPEGSPHRRRVAAARAHLDETEWKAAWAEGRAMSSERAIEYALAPEAPAPSANSGKPREARADGPSAEDTLTRREREVAALIARGLSNREISSELSISGRTVETHVRSILGKLGLKSRFQLAAR